MKIKILFWWDELREKIWFIPSVFCFIAVAIVTASLTVDRVLADSPDSWLLVFETTGASGRIILGALIGSLVTVMGLVFSLTVLSVSQTSSQYGPRLIRSVFDSNVAQNTMGLVLATVVFCMIVLRTIRDLESTGSLFTPHLSILLAELAGGTCIFALLAFTSHVTRCMRAETLIQGVYSDLLNAAHHIFPEVQDEFAVVAVERWESIEDGIRLKNDKAGYLQAIELPGLVASAEEHGDRVQIEKKIGEFVYRGAELARIQIQASEHDSTEDKLQHYRSFFLLGTTRTPRQDIEAGVLELVEAGVRALSPGINDPMTAINVIDYVSSFLRNLANREWPKSVLVDKNGIPRVRVRSIRFPSVLDAGFNQLRQNAGSSVAVTCRLLEGLIAIAEAAKRPEDRQAIHRQSEMILRAAERVIEEQNDLAEIRNRAEALVKIEAPFADSH